MKCPSCSDSSLLIAERQGIEIDYCPQCRGVWLDRGELDKIIERSIGIVAESRSENRTYAYAGRTDQEHGHESGHHGHYGRKRGWLGELFD